MSFRSNGDSYVVFLTSFKIILCLHEWPTVYRFFNIICSITFFFNNIAYLYNWRYNTHTHRVRMCHECLQYMPFNITANGCYKYNSTNTKRWDLLVLVTNWLSYRAAIAVEMRVRTHRSQYFTDFFSLIVSCSYCCIYNILFNINLYRCLKMHISNYFQILKINDIFHVINSDQFYCTELYLFEYMSQFDMVYSC